MRNYKQTAELVIEELSGTTSRVEESQVNQLINLIENADKVFFVGVGRVLLSLEAIAKRLAHLGIDCYVVGQITEPAITENDLLIVGSGSGESIFPVSIVKKAKAFGAKVAHIGANPDCTISEYSDVFVRIPTASKLVSPDQVTSKQPMTSLFEQTLLLLGDTIALMIVEKNNIEIHDLWQYHANLE